MPAFVWICFIVFVLAMILLDLAVFHRKARVISLPEALGWTAVWFALALSFTVFVYFLYADGSFLRPQLSLPALTGREAALQFFTGFLVEKSLSVDNIFVIAMILAYFRVPLDAQHRLLIWGAISAVLFRCLMLGAGAMLFKRLDWVIYLFGILIIVSAGKMLVMRHDNIEPDRNLVVWLIRHYFPLTDDYNGSRFMTQVGGKRAATPLFLALVLIETSDVMFAIDSIPAIFAITRDPFLVWTSNIFALLGLRSLYFVLSGLMHRFRYMKMSLVFLLVYVGVKMLLSHYYPIPNTVSLAMIGGILLVGVAASLGMGSRDTAALLSPLADQLEELVEITLRQARRVLVLLFGSTILVIGAAMIVLPGPALLMIPLGLGILAIEFAWARRWLVEMRRRADGMRRHFNRAPSDSITKNKDRHA